MGDANVLVFGIPFDGNASIGDGAKETPSVLRELSWWLPPFSMDGKSLEHIKIFDVGDYSFTTELSDYIDDLFSSDSCLKLVF